MNKGDRVMVLEDYFDVILTKVREGTVGILEDKTQSVNKCWHVRLFMENKILHQDHYITIVPESMLVKI